MDNRRDPYDPTDRDDLCDFHREMFHALYETDTFREDDGDEHEAEDEQHDHEDDDDDDDD